MNANLILQHIRRNPFAAYKQRDSQKDILIDVNRTA